MAGVYRLGKLAYSLYRNRAAHRTAQHNVLKGLFGEKAARAAGFYTRHSPWDNWVVRPVKRHINKRVKQYVYGSAASAVAGGVYKAASRLFKRAPAVKRKRGGADVVFPYGSRSQGRSYRGKRYRGTGTTGHYHGRFARPKKVSAPGVYQKRGYVRETELHGTTRMDSANYLTLTSVDYDETSKDIAIAVLRHLMYRHHKIDYKSEYDKAMPTQLFNTVTGQPANIPAPAKDRIHSLSFVLQNRDLSGTVTEEIKTYTFNTADTLIQFAVWFKEQVVSRIAASNAAPNNSYDSSVRWDLSYYYFTFVAWPMDGIILGDEAVSHDKRSPCGNMVVRCFSRCTFLFQNVTRADEVSDITYNGDALMNTRLDSNPVIGKVYRFKDPLPQVRYVHPPGLVGELNDDAGQYEGLLSGNRQMGVIYPAVDPPRDWQSAPSPHQFSNCSGVANMHLEPGGIKKHYLNFSYKGNINVLMRGLHHIGTTNAQRILRDKFGTSLMFYWEKMVRTGTDPYVVLNWHLDRTSGAAVVGHKRSIMNKGSGVEVEPLNYNYPPPA